MNAAQKAPDTLPAGRLTLRAVTYLSPGIPLEFFEVVTRSLAKSLECEIELRSDERISGPMHGEHDPFRDGTADIGFLCSPSYLYLRSQSPQSVELIPAGFVFDDPRASRKPVYFSDVVVRDDHCAREFADLSGGVWAYNDECSLSGYFGVLQTLSDMGADGEFFAHHVRTGSHHASIEAILNGEVDGAAIDSTVLAVLRREHPEWIRRLRVVATWGPWPIQPVVLRADLSAKWRGRLTQALFDLNDAEDLTERLRTIGFDRCAPIDDNAYAEERRALCLLGQLPLQPTK
jgi:phosphonate transport system substrate-binding protein